MLPRRHPCTPLSLQRHYCCLPTARKATMCQGCEILVARPLERSGSVGVAETPWSSDHTVGLQVQPALSFARMNTPQRDINNKETQTLPVAWRAPRAPARREGGHTWRLLRCTTRAALQPHVKLCTPLLRLRVPDFRAPGVVSVTRLTRSRLRGWRPPQRRSSTAPAPLQCRSSAAADGPAIWKVDDCCCQWPNAGSTYRRPCSRADRPQSTPETPG